MEKIEKGNFVKLCYKGMLENGDVFDRTDKCKPLEVQVGEGTLLQGVEKELIGMSLNEKKSFILGPDEAYGRRDERLERSFEKSNLDLAFEPAPGQLVVFMTRDGQELPAMIKFVNDDLIIADFNHPLAGKSLEFEVQVAEIAGTDGDNQPLCEAECCCA